MSFYLKKELIIVASLTIGNFLYQLIFKESPDYRVAADRSFFQAVAIFTTSFLR